jgi:hypothetical protein
MSSNSCVTHTLNESSIINSCVMIYHSIEECRSQFVEYNRYNQSKTRQTCDRWFKAVAISLYMDETIGLSEWFE